MFLWKRRRQWVFRKQRTRKKKNIWLRILVWVVVLSVLGLLLYGTWYGTRHSSVTITDVTVAGGETINHADVRTRVQQLLRGNYLLLVPRTFTYLYPHDEIVASIERIPRVHSVSVERTSRNTLRIAFEEYTPFALWCRSIDAYSRELCLFIGESGYAFDTAPGLQGAAIVRIATSYKEPTIADTVFDESLSREESKAQLAGMREFAEALASEQDMRVRGVTISEQGNTSYHIVGGGDIIVPPSISIQDAFDTLDSVLASDEFTHITPGNFEYIDLRFDSRVFVKEETEDENEDADDSIDIE